MVSQFAPLVNTLCTILSAKSNTEVQDIKEKRLEPNTIPLFVTTNWSVTVSHVNRFSRFLRKQNLIFRTVARKFAQLKNLLHQLSVWNGPSFQEHAVPLLKLSHERMVLAQKLCNTGLTNNNQNLNECISKFTSEMKSPFMAELIAEFDVAFELNGSVEWLCVVGVWFEPLNEIIEIYL